MADYKRMVSYMYQYESGIKKKNVGFARIEAKDGQCKITLHMQLLGQLDSIFPTYLIQRGSGNTELIYLGDALLKNQIMDSRLIADEKNIMASGYGLSDMGGILLFLNDNVFFATEWDDKPIVAAEVLEALRPKVKAVDKEEEKTVQSTEELTEDFLTLGLTLEEELAIPKYKLPRGYKTIERMLKPERMTANVEQVEETLQYSPETSKAYAPEGMSVADIDQVSSDQVEYRAADNNIEQAAIELESAEVEAAENIMSEEVEGILPKEAEDLPQEEVLNMGLEENAEDIAQGEVPIMAQEEEAEDKDTEQPDPKVASDIFEKYLRIYPFEDNEILLCVKLEPKDIGLLPKELWALSNNSFLVHGYYCYHHLIFAKLKDRYGCRFILGVPGIYHDRERFMAKMFGFESFKPIRRRELRQGDFGYWYMQVNF